MIARTSIAIAVLAVLTAGPAHADVFRCGKTFMTFVATDDNNLGAYEGVTVRKSYVLRVFGPTRETGIPAFLALKPLPTVGPARFAFIDDATHVRVLECLD